MIFPVKSVKLSPMNQLQQSITTTQVCKQINQYSFSEIEAELATLPNLPNFLVRFAKIKNPLNMSKNLRYLFSNIKNPLSMSKMFTAFIFAVGRTKVVCVLSCYILFTVALPAGMVGAIIMIAVVCVIRYGIFY